MSFDQDEQFIAHKVKSAEASTCGDEPGWNLTFEEGFGIWCPSKQCAQAPAAGETAREGFGIWCPSKQCAQAPAAGETARLYGKGFGFNVRGIVIEGRVYRYRTVDEAEEDFREEQRARKRAEQERFERERPMRDAGHAQKFAAGYLQTPHLLPQFHAAICALIGCEEAGCFAGRGKS